MSKQSIARRGLVGAALVLCWACSSKDSGPGAGSNAGASGATANAGAAGTAAGGTSTGGTGSGNAGTANGGGGAGGTGGAAGGAGGASGGMAGATGGGGVGGSAGGTGGSGGGGPVVSASCADHDYDLCIDFESGIDTNVWQGGTENSIVTDDFAHGGHSYRLYSCADEPPPVDGASCGSAMSAGKLVASNLGAITDKIWGRFYVHFDPGAPGGHGNIVGAFDQSDAWYEMGWQFDGMMGVWHAPGGNERPLRSTPYIVDQWYCIELLFDGSNTEMPQWWIDGEEAMYHMSANEGLTPTIVTQFDRIEVGFTPYAGLGIRQPDGVGDQTEMRTLTGMWIDDIAFDTERIGCITE